MDDWQKKYYMNRMNGMQMPHEQPQQIQGIPGMPSVSQGEVDINQLLQQRLAAGIQQNPGHNTNGFMPQGFKPHNNDPQQVNLKVGKTYYVSVSTGGGFQAPVPLIKEGGKVVEQMSKNVILKKTEKCYLIDNMTVVDLARINENPQLITEVCLIEIPWIGKVYVTRDAIVENNSRIMPDGRQILKG